MMKGYEKKIVIIDPSLINDRGHNLKIAKKFLNIRKYKRYLVTSKKFNNKVNSNIQIIKFFKSDFYNKEKDYLFFLRMINLIMFKLNLNKNDIVIFPTVDGLIINFIFKISLALIFFKLPTFVVNFFYDPKGSIPNKSYSIKKFSFFINLFKINHKFIFLCDNPVLKKKIEKDAKIDLILFFPESKKVNDSKKKVISFLGNARDEKGFNKIPNIILQFMKSYPITSKKITFKVQCTKQNIGYKKSILKTIQNLEKISNHKIELIKNNLSNNKFNKILRESMIIICPYDQKEYKYRSSLIFFEAIYNHAILINQKGMFIDKIFKKNQTSCKTIKDYSRTMYKIIKSKKFRSSQINKQNKFISEFKINNLSKIIS